MSVKTFQVIMSSDLLNFETYCSEMIEDGWSFHGDMKIIHLPTDIPEQITFLQAFVLKPKSSSPFVGEQSL